MLHKVTGVLTVLIFLGTGAYMRFNSPDQRMMVDYRVRRDVSHLAVRVILYPDCCVRKDRLMNLHDGWLGGPVTAAPEAAGKCLSAGIRAFTWLTIARS